MIEPIAVQVLNTLKAKGSTEVVFNRVKNDAHVCSSFARKHSSDENKKGTVVSSAKRRTENTPHSNETEVWNQSYGLPSE